MIDYRDPDLSIDRMKARLDRAIAARARWRRLRELAVLALLVGLIAAAAHLYSW